MKKIFILIIFSLNLCAYDTSKDIMISLDKEKKISYEECLSLSAKYTYNLKYFKYVKYNKEKFYIKNIEENSFDLLTKCNINNQNKEKIFKILNRISDFNKNKIECSFDFKSIEEISKFNSEITEYTYENYMYNIKSIKEIINNLKEYFLSCNISYEKRYQVLDLINILYKKLLLIEKSINYQI